MAARQANHPPLSHQDLLCLQQCRETELRLQYLNLLMKNLMVLLLLVQHVLLLRLLQRPLVHVPTIHLLKLLTLLQ